MSYTYDPDTRQYVADLLLKAIPAYFRTADESPAGREELRRLLTVLAAPLAIARQSIEELHANLFIDTADDWVLRYLAEMVGTTLIFPDADSNRRDIRSTIDFRRRKGTPSMLEEMGETLTAQMVVTQEGWKLVQMTQDLNQLRKERVIPDIRPAILAETESGPLCETHHLVDVRSVSRTSGIFHPKHVAHWAHPTTLFPLEEGYPFGCADPHPNPDSRWAFHPLGAFLPLRVRRPSKSDRTIKTDTVPPMHFRRSPGVWFDQPGRFSVMIGGVAAALATPVEQPTIASTLVAAPVLADGNVSIRLLDFDPERFSGSFKLEVVMVALVAGIPKTVPASSVNVRAFVNLSASGADGYTVVDSGAVDPTHVVMLHLTPIGANSRYFPGCTVEIASDKPAGCLASEDNSVARRGFLCGAMTVRIPATQVRQHRWLYLSLDGSCYEAQENGVGSPKLAVTNGTLAPETLIAQGPGPAWPPTIPGSNPEALTRIPNAPGRGPLVLHGGRVLIPGGATFKPIGVGQDCALVFALRAGAAEYYPFLRLSWTGPDPTTGKWAAIDDAAADTDFNQRLGEIADLREQRIDEVRLLVRFECQRTDGRFAPAEVVWPGYDGVNVLVYLPELRVTAANPNQSWSLLSNMAGASDAVAIAADGSTWNETMSEHSRASMGNIAPIGERVSVQRRVVQQRRLCAWKNENPPVDLLSPTHEGQLDLDVEYGLFSLAGSEEIRPYPEGPPKSIKPPSVTVAFQEGYTDHIGARPAAREPLIDARLETPTRIISGSGRLHRTAPASWFGIARYATLSDALQDVASDPHSTEVIQFEDSATYAAEKIVWPAGVQRLVIQAAERERPNVIVANWTVAANAQYDELAVLGIAWSADAAMVCEFPPAAVYRLRYVSILNEGLTLKFDLTGAAEENVVEITHSLTAGLTLKDSGEMRIADSVVDAGHAPGVEALTANAGDIYIDRSTVFGTVECHSINASECIFANTIVVTDQFKGCVRYSRVTNDLGLPRRHRLAKGVDLKFSSLDRYNPAHARLAVDADRRILTGAEDGGEMGAFHECQLALRYEAYRTRLEESTPAGLITGIIRSE